MSKKILIDASSSQETRIALIQDGKLDDFEIEPINKGAVKGNVYLAKITRVEPSLQAAFVDFGSARHGFLSLTEIHPDYFKIPVSDQETLKGLSSKIQNEEIENYSQNKNQIDQDEFNVIKKKHYENNKKYLNFFKKYKIQEVIKPRQIILVQINKVERGFKGAALTTFLSFAGRYCVLMPNSLNNNGISRKINDIEDRKKLKSILDSISIPENMSVIIRTAGINKTKKEIKKDLEFLISQWNKIRETTLKSAAPTLIYEEGNLIMRTLRDLLTNDVNEIIIEGKEGYNISKKYVKSLVASQVKKIKLFNKPDKTLFNDNNIEKQINDLFSLKVNLDSGGSIVINTTEALVAVDVNSGKNTYQRNIESTALNTNLEAAREIARQLRLRDLGGLIVIDFIDMGDYRNNFKVEKAIKTALYKDRARIQVGRISMFGLLELSRQRFRSSLIDRSYQKCHYCNGSGIILNSIAICEQIIKVVNEKLINNDNSKIEVKCNITLADILLNSMREEIQNIEKKYKSKIIFKLNHLYSLHEPEISLVDKVVSPVEEKISKSKAQKKRLPKKKIVQNKIKKKISKKILKKEKNVIKDNQLSEVIKKDEKNIKTGWWVE